MKNRRFPYGYEMRDGEIVICQTEAEIVRTIFVTMLTVKD